jgi:hypothetical protein
LAATKAAIAFLCQATSQAAAAISRNRRQARRDLQAAATLRKAASNRATEPPAASLQTITVVNIIKPPKAARPKAQAK